MTATAAGSSDKLRAVERQKRLKTAAGADPEERGRWRTDGEAGVA
jgi:hypothetical protein